VSDRLLSPTDLAEYLRVPRSTVYGWNYKGNGPPAIRIGKHVRYRSAAVERWLEERQTS
jgi:excisionase family DNA binding protein